MDAPRSRHVRGSTEAPACSVPSVPRAPVVARRACLCSVQPDRELRRRSRRPDRAAGRRAARATGGTTGAAGTAGDDRGTRATAGDAGTDRRRGLGTGGAGRPGRAGQRRAATGTPRARPARAGAGRRGSAAAARWHAARRRARRAAAARPGRPARRAARARPARGQRDDGAGNNTGGNGFYHMERLNRGVVAVQRHGRRLRRLAHVRLRVRRRQPGERLVQRLPQRRRWSRTSPTAPTTSTRRHRVVDVHGARGRSAASSGADSETATVWAQQYLRIPLQVPPGGTTPSTCPTAERGLHLQRQRRQRRRRRRRRPLRDHPQVGSVEREGQLAVGLHRQRVHRRLHADGHAAVAHRSRAQHPRRRALHAVRRLRLRRRRQGRDGGEDGARHARTAPATTSSSARRRTTTTR